MHTNRGLSSSNAKLENFKAKKNILLYNNCQLFLNLDMVAQDAPISSDSDEMSKIWNHGIGTSRINKQRSNYLIKDGALIRLN